MADDEDEKSEEPSEGEENESEEGAEGEDGEDGDGEGGKDKKKLILLIAVPLVLLLGGGAAAYFTGMLDGLLGKGGEEVVLLDDHGEPVLDEHGEPVMVSADEADGEDGEEGADDDYAKKDKKKGKKDKKGKEEKEGKGDGYGDEGGPDGRFLAIPTMIVNLNSDDGTPRYLRLTVQLEMEDSGDAHEVEAVMPRVVDQFQTYLRELRVKDLRGSAGIYRLQTELLWRVNQAADPIEVKDVLFQEILIQ